MSESEEAAVASPAAPDRKRPLETDTEDREDREGEGEDRSSASPALKSSRVGARDSDDEKAAEKEDEDEEEEEEEEAEDEEEDDDDEDDEEEESVPVKKKSRKEKDKKKRRKDKDRRHKKKSFVDDEAEESGDDDLGSDDDESVEDQDQYEDDGMIVLDEDEDDDEDDEDRTERRKAVEHKRLKKSKHLSVVEDEDLELLQDNLMEGIERRDRKRASTSEINPERIRHDDNIYDEDIREDDGEQNDEDSDKVGTSGSATARHNRYADDYDSDEMKGFIEDDDDEEEGDGVEDEEAREERRRRRKEQERAHMLGGGPSREQLEEAIALFGEGFEDLDDDSDEEGDDDAGNDMAAKEAKRMQKLRSRFERSTLVESFCTDHDDDLRATDRPERLIDTMAGRVPPDDKERLEEATWISAILAKKIYISLNAERDAHRNAEYSGQPSTVRYRPELWQMEFADIKTAIRDSVVSVLEFFQLEDKEVPFVWSYRKDYLHKDLLTRDHLWLIQEQDELWEQLVSKKRRLLLDWKLTSEAAVTDTDPAMNALSAKALAMKVSTKEIALEQLTAALEASQEELEAAQQNLEAVRSGGRGSAKVKVGSAAKSWEDDDDDEDELEDEAEEGADSQERLTQAETRLGTAEEEESTCRAKAEAVQKELQELVATQQNSLRSHTCSPAVAKNFLELFPIDRYEAILSHTNEEEEINDCHAYSALLFKGCQAEAGSSEDGSSEDVTGAKKKLRKGMLDKDQLYFKARKAPKLREFVQLFNVAACELGDALRFGAAMKMDPPVPPSRDIYDVAAEFVSPQFPSADSVKEGARCIIATEIAYEPSIRSAARNVFKRHATLCSRPTPYGCEVINPFHELFGVHLITHKPLYEMLNATGTDRHLFARLMLAQKEGLIVVSLHTPHLNVDVFLLETGLKTFFFPTEGHPWDAERNMILQEAAEKHLLPDFHTEAKRELMRQSRDAIIEESANTFQRMLSVGPYRPSRVSAFDVLEKCPERATRCTVASIFLPTDGRDAIFFAFVDKDGLVRAHDLLPGKVSKQKKDKIRSFLKACLPDVVVINTGAGQVAKSTKDMIEKYLVKEVQDLCLADRAAKREQRRARNHYGYDDDDDEEEDDMLFSPDVLLVKDDVARIFGTSTRARKMFPEVLEGGAAAICLARFVQDPLTEYANMWTSADSIGFFGYESFFLDIHPLKSVVERAKVPLLRALERCLVNTVCDVGVDINMAVSHNHLAGPLAFVAGLGLRKADALRSNIKSALGFVSSRRELFERKLLGRVVYTNAIGYLRVCDNGISDIQMDPLDDTRIHPECYVQNDFAPKICASALGIEHSAELYIKTVLRLREHCIRELKKNLESNYSFKDAWLTRGELLELPDKMELLELDDYANEVEAAGKGKRFRQFEEIKEELRYPWLDRRMPLPDCPSEYEMFSLITGETDQSVYVGLHVACTVLELKSRSADVMTEVGIRGFARMQNCSDQHIEDVSEVLQKGACVEGVVVAVIKPQFRVEISFRESDVSKDEAYWFGNRNTHEGMKAWWRECRMSPKAKEQCSSMMYVTIDPYFQEAEALHQYTATYEAKQQKINREHQNEANSGVGGQVKHGNNHRAVFHPLFHNMSSKQAENFLNSGDAEVGDVVIRPSSSDKDTLVVTWMYLPGKFKHIEVSEHNKLEDQGGIGQELRIRGEDEDFTDLDEIFARYIQPMNDLVTNLVGYRCYKEFRPQDQDNGENLGPGVVYMSLEDWLNQEILAAPNRIPYCICLHEKGVPGYFQLSWLRNAGHKVYTEYIAIKPDGYRLRDNFFPTPSELINWFKQNANKAQAAPTRKSRFSSGPPQQSQQSQLPQQTQYSQQTQEFSQQSQFPHEQQYPTPPVQYAVPPPPPQQQYFPPPPPPGSQF